MKSRLRIAVFGLNTLEFSGLRNLLSEEEEVVSEGFGSLAEFLPFSERFDAYITDADSFVVGLDFFLPRKGRTLVLERRKTESRIKEGLSSVWIGEDESEIRGVLQKFLISLNGGDQAGELSQREIEVLRLIAKGLINKEIADALCISVNTVITHRKNITSKLGVKSASGLSLYAMMNGLI